MRIFQVSPDGMASLFDAHHAKEAAEHGECSCPPGICLDGATPAEPGMSGFPPLEEVLGDLMTILAEDDLDDEDADDLDFDVIFEPEFDLSDEPASRAQQLDQLGSIVEDVTSLAGLYATMVHEDRSQDED
ncbi:MULTISPECIES: hypothetical protein [unclassified Bradyrhizobium]|uniref:hypothetical protein n=1 Tax=unclassified Bradyrhizobium TaxID=2631580 RepID=UPI002916BDF6|nr:MULTISPECIES: hypothetical protein [unclassified Bradyrhizobium]